MKYTLTAAVALASLVSAQKGSGAAPPKGKGAGGMKTTSKQFTEGGCKGTVFIFARGSTEPGNVGFVIGPPVFAALSKGLNGDVAFEGVPYAAAIGSNMLPGGTDAGGIGNATALFMKVHEACPKSAILGGGYSQGSAVMHRTVEKLPAAVQDHIAGVILYGDTKNKQENGHIPKFPTEKSRVFCNPNDGVCGGALNVNGGHLSYSASIQPGANWLISRVQAWKKEKGIPDPSTPIPADAPMTVPVTAANSGSAPKAAKGAGYKGKGFKGKNAGAPKGSAPPAAAPADAVSPAEAPAAAPAAPAPAAPAEDSMAGMAGMDGM